MPNEEWLAEIHRRLTTGDPVASAELADAIYPLLVKKLSARNAAIVDADLIADACSEALINYLERPETYDPSRRGLLGYLAMSAQRDLQNMLDKLRRVAKRENFGKFVELESISWNGLSELGEKEQWEEVEQIVCSLFSDAKDREAALMIIDGVSATEAYASVLECAQGTKEEVEATVKRHKDRIKRVIKRKLGKLNG